MRPLLSSSLSLSSVRMTVAARTYIAVLHTHIPTAYKFIVRNIIFFSRRLARVEGYIVLIHTSYPNVHRVSCLMALRMHIHIIVW